MLLRSIFLLICLVSVSGCGALLSETVRTEREIGHAYGEPDVEIAATEYAMEATASFIKGPPRVLVELDAVRLQTCRRYTEVTYRTRTMERRVPAVSGIFLDAGVLGAGIIAGFLTKNVWGQTAFALGAAVPLGVDAYVHLHRPETDSPPMTRREAAPGEGTDDAGHFPCAMDTDPVEVTFADRAVPDRGGRLVLELDEDEVRSHGDETGLTLPLSAGNVAATVRVEPGEAYVRYQETVQGLPDRMTLRQMAQFMLDYPRSMHIPVVQRRFLQRVTSARNLEEMREITGLPGLSGELRSATHDRYTEVRVRQLRREVPEHLAGAWRAEREANTFFANGYRQAGEDRLDWRREQLASACRLYRELLLRDPAWSREAEAGWREQLSEVLRDNEGEAALDWLRRCHR